MNNELNSDISNNSAVYQTVMEELVCAVQRNELTLTLTYTVAPLLSSSETQGQLVGSIKCSWLIDPTNCPWVSEDALLSVSYQISRYALKRFYLGLVDHCMRTY